MSSATCGLVKRKCQLDLLFYSFLKEKKPFFPSGNLVTCDWWNSVWLHEGFGEYFEYFGAAMVSITTISYEHILNK